MRHSKTVAHALRVRLIEDRVAAGSLEPGWSRVELDLEGCITVSHYNAGNIVEITRDKRTRHCSFPRERKTVKPEAEQQPPLSRS